MAEDHLGQTRPPEALCKGSWALGTECGRCDRCLATAAAYVTSLRTENAGLRGMAELSHAHVSAVEARTDRVRNLLPRPHGRDLSDAFKVACFDEARRLFYEEGDES